jgi:hypothetical protein
MSVCSHTKGMVRGVLHGQYDRHLWKRLYSKHRGTYEASFIGINRGVHVSGITGTDRV